MIKINAEFARAIAAEVKLNLDCFDFDTAVSKNKALHDLLVRLCNSCGNYNNAIWYDIQSIYKQYMRSDMEHLYNIEVEVINYIDKWFNDNENEEIGLTD